MEQPGYVELVGRSGATQAQNKIPGYHLRLTDKGHWSLFLRTISTDKILASGNMPSAAGTGQWRKLSLNFAGDKITAAIDGTVVAKDIANAVFANGLAGYQVSRWQNADFMNFEALPAN